jgi:hypothetical protein
MLRRELDDLKQDEWALATTGAHGDVVMLREMGLFPSALGSIGNRDMVQMRAARIVEAAAAELQNAMLEAKAKQRRR